MCEKEDLARNFEFHSSEFASLREEIGRFQEMRAELEKVSLGLIIVTWGWASTQSQSLTWSVLGVLVWWLPVITCAFTIHRIYTIRRGIRLIGDYLAIVHSKYASGDIGGWETWLRSNTRQKGDKRGLTLATLNLWWFLIMVSTIIAGAATYLYTLS